jgi:hypothetical protein
LKNLFVGSNKKGYLEKAIHEDRGIFIPAAESHGLWLWMNALSFGRDVAPLGRQSGATSFARGAPLNNITPLI